MCFKGKPKSINKLGVKNESKEWNTSGVYSYYPIYYNYDYDDSNISPTSFVSKPILEKLGPACQFAYTCKYICFAQGTPINQQLKRGFPYVLKQANDDFKACSTAASQSAISAKTWTNNKIMNGNTIKGCGCDKASSGSKSSSSHIYPCLSLREHRKSPPKNFTTEIKALLYNTDGLPTTSLNFIQYALNYPSISNNATLNEKYKYFSNLSDYTFEITYEIDWYKEQTKKNTDLIYDIFYLLSIVSSYPSSNGILNPDTQLSVNVSNQNTAFNMMQDYCMNMKQACNISSSVFSSSSSSSNSSSSSSSSSNSTSTNFCCVDYDGPIPGILSAGASSTSSLSENYKNYEQASVYISTPTPYRSGKPIPSYPQGANIYNEYCSKSTGNLVSNECQEYFKNMYSE